MRYFTYTFVLPTHVENATRSFFSQNLRLKKNVSKEIAKGCFCKLYTICLQRLLAKYGSEGEKRMMHQRICITWTKLKQLALGNSSLPQFVFAFCRKKALLHKLQSVCSYSISLFTCMLMWTIQALSLCREERGTVERKKTIFSFLLLKNIQRKVL